MMGSAKGADLLVVISGVQLIIGKVVIMV